MNTEQIKNELAQLNDDMLNLFVRRMELVAQLGKERAAEGKPLFDRKAEEEVLETAAKNSPQKMQNYSIEFFRTMMSLSREYYDDVK